MVHYVRHPDDKFYDAARIVVVERYKTSSFSGDEWRFSHAVELLRKGAVIAKCMVGGSFEYAAAELAAVAHLGPVEIEGRRGWEVLGFEQIPSQGFCCQPGCENKSVHHYELHRIYDKSCMLSERNNRGYRREFCEQHKNRGDCGFDDADANYTAVVPEASA